MKAIDNIHRFVYILGLSLVLFIACQTERKDYYVLDNSLPAPLDTAKCGPLAKTIANNISNTPGDWEEIFTEADEERPISSSVVLINKTCGIKIEFFIGAFIGYSTVDLLAPDTIQLDRNDSRLITDSYYENIVAPHEKMQERLRQIEARKQEIIKRNKEKEVLNKICKK